MRQQYCSPGFESQTRRLRFLNLYLNCDVNRRNKQKEAGIAHILLNWSQLQVMC